MANYKTNLGTGSARFDHMMKNGFGIVTVMNAKVFNTPTNIEDQTAYAIYQTYKDNVADCLCELKTLKVANVSQEGPTKTVTGGQFSNPLIKFGKTARLEMQDALGSAKAIDALCGGISESQGGMITGLHFGEDFVGPKMIIGDSFFIDQKTGQQVKVAIIFYQFLPDSIFNLTQDAEGDATVFDMNGDLLTTIIQVGNNTETGTQSHGVFYSIIDPLETDADSGYFTIEIAKDTGVMTLTANPDYVVSPTTIAKDSAARVKVTKDSVIVFDEVIKNY